MSRRLPGGRVATVAGMGALSAVIVSPCVAAPLAGALLYIAQTRDVALGGAALFAMALGMGVPLVIVGVSEGALLPKSGPWLNRIKQLFGGSQHHCALMGNGGVRCWGDNPYAETTEWKLVPELDDVVQIAAGNDHTCARTRAGKVSCWGDDVWGQLGRVPSRVYLEPKPLPID